MFLEQTDIMAGVLGMLTALTVTGGGGGGYE
jgi:hypothetical protein